MSLVQQTDRSYSHLAVKVPVLTRDQRLTCEDLKEAADLWSVSEGELATMALMGGNIDVVEAWLLQNPLHRLKNLTHSFSYETSQYRDQLIQEKRGKRSAPISPLMAVSSLSWYGEGVEASFQRWIDFFDQHPEYQTGLDESFHDGQTPLMIAHPLLINALLRWGANPHVQSQTHHVYASWVRKTHEDPDGPYNVAKDYKKLTDMVFPDFNPQSISHILFKELMGLPISKFGHRLFPDVLQGWIDQGLRIECPVDALQQVHPLALSIEWGKPEITQFLYNQGQINALWKDPETGKTLFHIGFEGSKVIRMNALKGIPINDLEPYINTQDKAGNTPLHAATAALNLDWVQLLLRRGALPNVLNKRKKHPLDMIRKTNDKAHQKLHLLWEAFDRYSGTVKVQGEPLPEAMFFKACASFSTETFAMILEKYPDFNLEIKNLHGRTPLHHVVSSLPHYWDEETRVKNKNKQLNALQYLVGKGAQINTQDNNRDTPLHEATKNYLEYLVTFLLDQGANPFIVNEQQIHPADMVNYDDNEGLSDIEIENVWTMMKAYEQSGVNLFKENLKGELPFRMHRQIPKINALLEQSQLKKSTRSVLPIGASKRL